MRRLLLVIVVMLLTSPAVPTRAADDALVGTYRCEGKSPDGKPYAGLVEIIKHDKRFQVTWTFVGPDGDTQDISGIGIVVAGRFSVSYIAGITKEGIPVPAIAVYAITQGDPVTLAGEWAVPTDPGVHGEVLTKLPKGHPVPAAPAKPDKPPPVRKGEIKG